MAWLWSNVCLVIKTRKAAYSFPCDPHLAWHSNSSRALLPMTWTKHIVEVLQLCLLDLHIHNANRYCSRQQRSVISLIVFFNSQSNHLNWLATLMFLILQYKMSVWFWSIYQTMTLKLLTVHWAHTHTPIHTHRWPADQYLWAIMLQIPDKAGNYSSQSVQYKVQKCHFIVS